MKGADGKIVHPTGKTAKLEFCTVATWKNGEIVEERLFYDVVGMMKQHARSCPLTKRGTVYASICTGLPRATSNKLPAILGALLIKLQSRGYAETTLYGVSKKLKQLSRNAG